jgi:lipopolysaccharide export LptBFGC system permease protein LptF
MKSTKSELVEIIAARSAWVVTGVASRVASEGECQSVLVRLSFFFFFFLLAQWYNLRRRDCRACGVSVWCFIKVHLVHVVVL